MPSVKTVSKTMLEGGLACGFSFSALRSAAARSMPPNPMQPTSVKNSRRDVAMTFVSFECLFISLGRGESSRPPRRHAAHDVVDALVALPLQERGGDGGA